jgi:hypothetical protein
MASKTFLFLMYIYILVYIVFILYVCVYKYRRLELHRVMKKARAGERSIMVRTEAERTRLAKEFLAGEKRQRDAKRSCIAFQKLYRGHLGRRAAKRWAAKKAELEAMFALMTAAASSIQRVFRGFVGRMAAAEMRAEVNGLRLHSLSHSLTLSSYLPVCLLVWLWFWFVCS